MFIVRKGFGFGFGFGFREDYTPTIRVELIMSEGMLFQIKGACTKRTFTYILCGCAQRVVVCA